MTQDHSAAYQLGYMLGSALTITLILGGLVFFVLAVVKAITKGTTGWIVAACFMGVVSLGVLVVTVSAFVMGVSRAATDSTSISQSLTTKDGKFKVMVPGTWKLLPDLNPQADLVAGNMVKEQYMMIFVESAPAPEVDAARLLDVTSERMASLLKDSTRSSPAKLTIAGRPGLRCRITGQSQGVDLAYMHTCVKVDDSLVQLIFWTLASREATTFPTYEQIASTFRATFGGEPAPAASPATAAPPSK